MKYWNRFRATIAKHGYKGFKFFWVKEFTLRGLRHLHIAINIMASPSGGGKSTIAKFLLNKYGDFRFSVSATTRNMRPGEVNGKQYYFMSKEEFKDRLSKGEFVEHEEIFGNFYGTLHSEIGKAIENGEFLIFDIDVKGALSLRKAYPDETLLLFIAPPSMEVLESRLRSRSTETEEQIQTRLQRAEMEMSTAPEFDYVIINDVLEDTLRETDEIVGRYLGEKRD
jgi:guanylate kinase